MSRLSEVSGNSFEDGQLAGKELLELFLQIENLEPNGPKLAPKRIESVLEKIWNDAGARHIDPAVVGFFSEVMRPQSYETSIVSFWGLDQLLENQNKWVPVCELEEPRQAFQFAFWTGDFSDGDGWCYDIPQSLIRCVTVGCAPASMQELRDHSYGVYDRFHYFVSHLRCSARMRGWIA